MSGEFGHRVLTVDEYRNLPDLDDAAGAARQAAVAVALREARAIHDRYVAAGAAPMTADEWDAFMDDVRGRATDDGRRGTTAGK